MKARVPNSWRPEKVHVFEKWDEVSVRSLCGGLTVVPEYLEKEEGMPTCVQCARKFEEGGDLICLRPTKQGASLEEWLCGRRKCDDAYNDYAPQKAPIVEQPSPLEHLLEEDLTPAPDPSENREQEGPVVTQDYLIRILEVPRRANVYTVFLVHRGPGHTP